ncbi:hypothetical protein ACWEKT_24105 [Nocardia takedensis]
MISIEVGSDRLPVEVSLGRSWKQAFEPKEYGRSIVDAYRYGLYMMAIRMVESGELPPATVPTLREAAPILLRSRTLDEFRSLFEHLFNGSPITVHSPVRNAYGFPVMTVTATASELSSVDIDSDWAAGIDSNFIAQDVLECCRQIRAKRIHPLGDVHRSADPADDFAAQIVEHERYLLQHG